MSEQNIFDGTPPATPPVETVTPTVEPENALLTKLKQIKNDQGQPKYDSLEKALDALAASQEFIPQVKSEKEKLEAELAELRAKQSSMESVESIVEKLLQSKKPPEVPATTQEPKGLDKDSVAAIVREQQELLVKEQQAKANSDKVTKILTEKFGERTKEEVAKKAVELGMSPARLGQLATEAPDAVLRLFNTEQKAPVAPSLSDVNTSNFLKAPPKDLEKPRKSLLSGATSKEQAAFMKQVKERVYAKHGVTI